MYFFVIYNLKKYQQISRTYSKCNWSILKYKTELIILSKTLMIYKLFLRLLFTPLFANPDLGDTQKGGPGESPEFILHE